MRSRCPERSSRRFFLAPAMPPRRRGLRSARSLAGIALILGAIAACSDGSSATPDAAAPAASDDAQDRRCPVAAPAAQQAATTSGLVQGALDNGAIVYRGIPYAAPPVGALRFAAPAPAACWTGVRDASQLGAICPQWSDDHASIVGDEDCLTSNVWAPADAKPTSKLPVMVFIHGGGHQQGASSATQAGVLIYDGRPLAVGKRVVIVTFNYRLGALGYLAHSALATADPNHSTGNYGTLDQVAALRWVKDNIAAFGGDPARVTIFGESAGGEAVCTLVASPLAAGLFTAGIAESGPCEALPMTKAQRNADTVVATVGCATAADIPACLRSKTAVELAQTAPDARIGSLPYNATIDGYVLPASPIDRITAGAHNKVPLIIGTNRDEMGAQVPPVPDEATYKALVTALATSVGAPNLAPQILARYPVTDYASPRAAYVALLTDAYFACPARGHTRALAAHQPQPVYRYVFTHLADNASAPQRAFGVVHGSELPFVFASLPNPGINDSLTIANFATYWSQLAITGSPNASGILAWPAVTTTSDPVLTLDASLGINASYRTTQCDFWAALGIGS